MNGQPMNAVLLDWKWAIGIGFTIVGTIAAQTYSFGVWTSRNDQTDLYQSAAIERQDEKFSDAIRTVSARIDRRDLDGERLARIEAQVAAVLEMLRRDARNP
jgi:hypothetical protein